MVTLERRSSAHAAISPRTTPNNLLTKRGRALDAQAHVHAVLRATFRARPPCKDLVGALSVVVCLVLGRATSRDRWRPRKLELVRLLVAWSCHEPSSCAVVDTGHGGKGAAQNRQKPLPRSIFAASWPRGPWCRDRAVRRARTCRWTSPP